MTRTEFLNALSDVNRERRGRSGIRFTPKQEAEAHAWDRNEAARRWRREKNRLQNLTVEQWKKQESNL